MNYRLCAVACLLCLAGLASADDCKRVRTVYQTYQAPACVAPAYTYTPQYQVYVPKVLEVASYANHSYSIDSYYQQSLLADAIVGRLLRMQQIQSAGGSPASNGASRPAIAPEPQPMQQPAPQRQVMPAAAFDLQRPSAFQSPELVQVIQQSCMKCHGTAPRIPLLTADGKQLLDLPKRDCLDVYYRVNTGQMPKAAAPIEDKYMPLFAKWVDASK